MPTTWGREHVACNCLEHFGIRWLETLDRLVNDQGVDQLTASRMLLIEVRNA